MDYYQAASSLILGMGEVMDNPRLTQNTIKVFVNSGHREVIRLVGPKVAMGIYSETMRHRPGIAACVDLLMLEDRFDLAGVDVFDSHRLHQKALGILDRLKTHRDEMKLEAEVDRAFDLMTKMRRNPNSTWYDNV